MRVLIVIPLLLIVCVGLAGCCASNNPWHTAKWEYGYTPKGE